MRRFIAVAALVLIDAALMQRTRLGGADTLVSDARPHLPPPHVMMLDVMPPFWGARPPCRTFAHIRTYLRRCSTDLLFFVDFRIKDAAQDDRGRCLT